MAIETLDVNIVVRARQGDREAFRLLFEATKGRTFNYMLRMIRNVEDAKDLTQEVYAKAFFALPGLRQPEAFYGWLKALVVNRVRDYLRSAPARNREVSLEEMVETSGGDVSALGVAAVTPEEDLLARERSAEMEKAIDGLPDIHREVVLLHHIEGLPVEHIASLLRVPPGTVKSRLARARGELASKLSGYTGLKGGS